MSTVLANWILRKEKHLPILFSCIAKEITCILCPQFIDPISISWSINNAMARQFLKVYKRDLQWDIERVLIILILTISNNNSFEKSNCMMAICNTFENCISIIVIKMYWLISFNRVNIILCHKWQLFFIICRWFCYFYDEFSILKNVSFT